MSEDSENLETLRSELALLRTVYANKKAQCDRLIEEVKDKNQLLFNHTEEIKEKLEALERRVREAIVMAHSNGDVLPDGFGVRTYIKYHVFEDFRTWCFANMPVLLVVDEKKASAVLKTGLFDDAPATKTETRTATIAKELK